jgi:hypothetical protein
LDFTDIIDEENYSSDEDVHEENEQYDMINWARKLRYFRSTRLKDH